ncbi:unannotated protein [freshwater metagenome]|uniref:Unannotated protein n=1 Tax=freshwater metagenome TaxID=449393 RepID=A0A6J7DLK9_9ZZZZ|nr:DUF1385 domain-containing protein [Actinomycetota bacterium]
MRPEQPEAQHAFDEEPGEWVATRDAPVGGQAVLEGVMMRGVRTWAVACRTPAPEQLDEAGERLDLNDPPSGEIIVETHEIDSILKRHRALRLPVVRGVIALGQSLGIGFKALGIAANAQVPGEEEEISGWLWTLTIVLSLALAVGLFFIVPVTLTNLIKDQLGSAVVFWIVEGVLRTLIFLLYLILISKLRDLRRVFEYHGAEHKTISCYEAGLPLTPENAQRFSRLHPRCGTSFLLIVMVVAIFVFSPLGMLPWWALIVSRIAGVPVIAGISFEIIKLAGKHRARRWVRAIMWPGLKLQLLTTREPDLDQLAVAIVAMNAVLARETPGSFDDDDLIGVEIAA